MGEIIRNGESYSGGGEGPTEETSRLIKIIDIGQNPNFELLRFTMTAQNGIRGLPIIFRYSTNMLGITNASKVSLWLSNTAGVSNIWTDVALSGPGKLWYSAYQMSPRLWTIQILVNLESGGPLTANPLCYIWDVTVPEDYVTWFFGPEDNIGTALIGGSKTEIPLSRLS